MSRFSDVMDRLKAGDARAWRDWLFWTGLVSYLISVPGQFTNGIVSGQLALALFVASAVVAWRAS